MTPNFLIRDAKYPERMKIDSFTAKREPTLPLRSSFHWFADMLYAMPPLNKCRNCGTTSYRSVIARDATGAMRPSGVYQCTGCRLLFTELDDWRGIKSEAKNHLPKSLDQSRLPRTC
jgi:hypothetical protein